MFISLRSLISVQDTVVCLVSEMHGTHTDLYAVNEVQVWNEEAKGSPPMVAPQ
jgi:hypothetical protein